MTLVMAALALFERTAKLVLPTIPSMLWMFWKLVLLLDGMLERIRA